MWCALIGVALVAGFAVGGDLLIRTLTSLPEVQQTAGVYLPWLIAIPLVCLAPFLLDGLFIGTTRTKEMRNSMVVSVLVYLALWYATLDWGNHGLWMALTGFMLARSATLGFYCRRIGKSGGFVARRS